MARSPELSVCASCLEPLGDSRFFLVTGMPGRYCTAVCAQSAADAARGLLWGDDEED